MQAQLDETTRWWVRKILGTDEEKLKEFVMSLAMKKLAVETNDQLEILKRTKVVLGTIKPAPGTKGYRIEVDMPLCQRYGDGRGAFGVVVEPGKYISKLRLDIYCGDKLVGYVWAAHIMMDEEVSNVTAYLDRLYDTYNLLYNVAGVGGRPLLELARKAEEAGDSGVAGVLRNLYKLFEEASGVVREVERRDYSKLYQQLRDTFARRKAEEAAELLRKAKEAIRRGDIDEARRLAHRVNVLEVNRSKNHRYVIDLDSITAEMRGIHVGSITYLLEEYIPMGLGDMQRQIDLYKAFATAAKNLGLGVRGSE